MQLFQCSHCSNAVYFDNQFCTACQQVLGFDANSLSMRALQPQDASLFEISSRQYFKFCKNHQYNVCNWILHAEDSAEFCLACQLNRIIPNLNDMEYRQRWRKIELAKHRLVYALLRWQLPLVPKKNKQDQQGLAFDFKADPDCPNEPRILTGHDNGLITLNISEADDVERAMARNNMDEVYRTLLGHFRHEIGHYYWDVLVDNSEFLAPYRALFGDERLDYQQALNQHYDNGPPANWMEHYISSYATMHPWEDWAETWAHYLHVIDVLETADAFGLKLQPKVVQDQPQNIMHLLSSFDPYIHASFDDIYQSWLAVSCAMNSLNRSMGHDDFYPFVINVHVQEKMRFIHQVIQSARQKSFKVA